MDAKEAERRFQELQKLHRSGVLDDENFRLEAAKLLWRDLYGVFWMPDPETGSWFCNQGNGWAPGDPHAEPPAALARTDVRTEKRRRTGRLLLLSVVVLALLGAAVGLFYWQRGELVAGTRAATATAPPRIAVTIASPTDGSEIALGQVVAIEATLVGDGPLHSVERVDFRVDGELMAQQQVQATIQPGQTSLPVSQAWRPSALGQHRLAVAAYSPQGESLGTASIAVTVVERPAGGLNETACSPDAAFVADVTIPAGTAFPPGARMDKVWQVRNSGSCAWGVGHELVLVEGQALEAPHAMPVPPTAAGELADLAITFWAPGATGVYTSIWQLQAPDGQFFGPTLPLSIRVEAQALETVPPDAPADLEATVTAEGQAVRLTWADRSDNEDAFRIYREDVEASIGLAPANAQQFLDEGVACGHTYRYAVIAFNAAGVSPTGEMAAVSLPPCAQPPDASPTLILTVVPTQVVASETFTVVFQASDDLGVSRVEIQGQGTGEPVLDAGRAFTCTQSVCSGSWPLTWNRDVSSALTLTLTAVAEDAAGQASEPARTTVVVRPEE